ncbi:hypothetical protein H6P81_020704 [Aristolochia fimbriata]|uniref:Uncharacterized protein n=1 Tax=Aristolochia fimbriata TaxID=158543 RepID=A0AAV7DVH2_ARIFI|nr:hypothetical protein H6P81_020704 [Aristolochia fimbriata]
MQRKEYIISASALPSIPCKTPRLYCDHQDCPAELLHPPEDCNVNSSLSFTLQICRVEDITVAGLIEGGVIHFHRARTVVVDSSGLISVSGLGCFTNYLQAVPPTIWYRLVFECAVTFGSRDNLKATFQPVFSWLETHANPALSMHGVWVDLAICQATRCGYCQFGLAVYVIKEESVFTS